MLRRVSYIPTFVGLYMTGLETGKQIQNKNETKNEKKERKKKGTRKIFQKEEEINLKCKRV